jgi:regulator of nucleoside diphosphate kinase
MRAAAVFTDISMREYANDRQMPKIIVSETDYRRLTDLAMAVQGRMPEVADELLSEMDRAEVAAADAIPGNVVRMGSKVRFRADDGEERDVTLVFPGEADIAQGKISILTPVGAALIGLSQGQSITWAKRDGERNRLTVLSVEAPTA